MRVLLINTWDAKGGAARAAVRLHNALRKEQVDSRMLVQWKESSEPGLLGPAGKLAKLRALFADTFDPLPLRKFTSRSKALFSPAWVPSGVSVDTINALEPDVVHLHWINGGMLRIEDIARIRAPIVWSMHDMWPFTGGCHYDEECAGYLRDCGACKVLRSTEDSDLSRKVWYRKDRTYQRKKDIYPVGLSSWLAGQAKESSLFSNREVRNLPNPIDTEVFRPFDKAYARELLGLPKSKKLVLFGAMDAVSDPRKGYSQLASALQGLEQEDFELVVFGSSGPTGGEVFSHRVHYCGVLRDDSSLRALYSAADVMVVPSVQENLSNAIMESLACGTPVVAFDIGGNPDMVDHKSNGYLAKPFFVEDLAAGIQWVLNHKEPCQLSGNALVKIRNNFESSLVARNYIDLYLEVINNSRAAAK